MTKCSFVLWFICIVNSVSTVHYNYCIKSWNVTRWIPTPHRTLIFQRVKYKNLINLLCDYQDYRHFSNIMIYIGGGINEHSLFDRVIEIYIFKLSVKIGGDGTTYLIEHLGLLRICEIRIAQSFVFCVWFCNSLFVFLSFFRLPILLSVLWFTSSDCLSCIFKLFLPMFCWSGFVLFSLSVFCAHYICELCCRCGWFFFNSFTLVLSYSIYRLGIFLPYLCF